MTGGDRVEARVARESRLLEALAEAPDRIIGPRVLRHQEHAELHRQPSPFRPPRNSAWTCASSRSARPVPWQKVLPRAST